MMRPRAEAKGLEFHVKVNAEVPNCLYGDTRRIQQIYESMDLGGRHPEKYRTH